MHSKSTWILGLSVNNVMTFLSSEPTMIRGKERQPSESHTPSSLLLGPPVPGVSSWGPHLLHKPMQLLILNSGQGWRAQDDGGYFLTMQLPETSSALYLPEKMGREAVWKSSGQICSRCPDWRKMVFWECCLEFSVLFLPNSNVCLISNNSSPPCSCGFHGDPRQQGRGREMYRPAAVGP